MKKSKAFMFVAVLAILVGCATVTYDVGTYQSSGSIMREHG